MPELQSLAEESRESTGDERFTSLPAGIPPGVPQGIPQGIPRYAAGPVTSGLAIAGFVVSLVGQLACIIGPLVALILSIVALVQINDSQGRQQGKGLAIAGIVFSVLGFLLLPAILFPVFARARNNARSRIACMSNQRQIVLAVQMYIQDNDSKCPASFTDLSRYLGNAPQYFHCPADDAANNISYGYNTLLAGKTISDLHLPAETLCTADGGNAEHGLLGISDIVTTRHHEPGSHSGGFVASFADGHALFCPAGTPVNLTPSAARVT